MFSLNAFMAQTQRLAEQQMAERVRQAQAAAAAAAAEEQRKIAEKAAAEAKMHEEAANLAKQEAETKRLALIEQQRVDALVINAINESRGEISGSANMRGVFSEDQSVIEKFLSVNPLEQAITGNNLPAVQFLVSQGLRYENWQDVVDENTPMHAYLSEAFRPSSPKLKQ